MSTLKFPLDVPNRRTITLNCFLACLLALSALTATSLADSPIRSAQAQTSGENSLEAQEPTASINATQTNETNRNNDNFGQQKNDYLAANPSTVSSSGTSTTEVRPDQVSVTVGVETNGTTAQEAVSQNANLTAQVIAAAIGAGANRIDAVVFFVSQNRQQEIRDTLINDAIANARQRANIAAEALGMTLSGVESVTLNPI